MKSLIFASIFSFIIINILTQEQLRWTFELINHGARTPRSGLNENLKDFMNHTWIGQDELTGVGMRQSFLVGYRDRIRYIEQKELISQEYDPRDIFIYASESNKTLMSATALLQGLFLPGTGPLLEKKLVNISVPPIADQSSYMDEKEELDRDNFTALPGRMNLVPVHISFSHEYFTQFENSKKCKGLAEYEKNNKNRKEVTDFLEEMTNKYGKNLIKIFKNKDVNLLKDYDFAYSFFDTVISLYFDGAEEFDSLSKILEVEEEDLLKDCYNFMALNTVGNGKDNDEEFIDYLVSPLFSKIIHFMDYRIKKDKNQEKNYKGYDLPKYFILSGVSNTCGALMSFMKKYFDTPIKYANFSTNIHLELILENSQKEEITEDDYRLEYFYNDDFLLSIRYSDFKNTILKNLKSQNETITFCQTEKKDDGNNDLSYIIGIAVASVVLIIIIVVIVIMFKRRKKSNNDEINDKESLIRDTQNNPSTNKQNEDN